MNRATAVTCILKTSMHYVNTDAKRPFVTIQNVQERIIIMKAKKKEKRKVYSRRKQPHDTNSFHFTHFFNASFFYYIYVYH